MIQCRSTYAKTSFPPQQTICQRQIFQTLSYAHPRDHPIVPQVVPVPFPHFEARSAVFHTIPQDAVSHAGNLLRQAGWAVTAAGWKIANA